MDAVPGKIAHTTLHAFMVGRYDGQCSELCGVLHGFMPIQVDAVSHPLFIIWRMFNSNRSGYYAF